MKYQNNIQKIRKQHAITQQELADELGINKRTLQKWEAGEYELYNRAYNDIERQEFEIDTLKDKCVDLMLENADYVWEEIARETAKKRANTRKWRAKQ